MANGKSLMAVIRAARPSFRNNYDKISFAVHASFIASGFSLTATGKPAFSDDALYSVSSDEVGVEGWNELVDEYAFVYMSPEKGSKKVFVKCLVMNDNLLVDVLAEGEHESIHLEIDVGIYITESVGGNLSDQYKNVEKLMNNLNSGIFSRLHPSSKPSTGTCSSGNPARSSTTEDSRQDIKEPGFGFVQPTGPHIHPSGVVVPPVYNPDSGYNDLLPGPGAGVYLRRGGGMLVGPNDPLWFSGGLTSFHEVQPGVVPPGARFDPYGPPEVPGFEPNQFTRNPPRRPPGGTHPDLEHFRDGDILMNLLASSCKIPIKYKYLSCVYTVAVDEG